MKKNEYCTRAYYRLDSPLNELKRECSTIFVYTNRRDALVATRCPSTFRLKLRFSHVENYHLYKFAPSRCPGPHHLTHCRINRKRNTVTTRDWLFITSSSDGIKLAAVVGIGTLPSPPSESDSDIFDLSITSPWSLVGALA